MLNSWPRYSEMAAALQGLLPITEVQPHMKHINSVTLIYLMKELFYLFRALLIAALTMKRDPM